MSEEEQRFLKNVKKALDEGTDNLDAGTQSRLTQIRYKALESKSSRWGVSTLGAMGLRHL
jgi:hypothetical protein